MKKPFIGVIVLVLLLGSSFYLVSNHNPKPLETNVIKRLDWPLPEKKLRGGQSRAAFPPSDELFHAGVIDALLGGLYEGYLPHRVLKTHGDFGLGAPGQLDGELTLYGGKVYQTQHTGHTFPAADTAKSAFAFVHFFRPDQLHALAKPLSRRQTEDLLDSLLPESNGMYALALEGTFQVVKTRAFPPVTQKPAPPLVTLLDKQRFFHFAQVRGVLVGYRLPGLLGGVNVPGYHFHFLTADRQGGGHAIDFKLESGTLQIDRLHRYSVDLPQTEAFKAFDFSADRSTELKSVERGRP